MSEAENVEVIEAMAKAAAMARGPEPQFLWQEWLVEMQAALAAAKPFIEKELLKRMIGAAPPESMKLPPFSPNTKWGTRDFIRKFARDLGYGDIGG